jgi:glucosamine--fructose-6-phosphate aminotransferase (isomerizing)
MCGIIGYAGREQALPILVEGLKRLEYRGYDSAGIALHNGGRILWEKTAGKIQVLEKQLAGRTWESCCGIAHTRWATHGEPTALNAHPHFSSDYRVAVIHNGIIENFNLLKRRLEKEGYQFRSDTDTELLAHLIDKYYRGDLANAVQLALRQVEGTYGLVAIHADEPGKMVGARNGSPIVLGIGEGEYLIASDVAAIIRHTRQVVYLDDKEMVIIDGDRFSTTTLDNVEVDKTIEEVDWDLEAIEKGGFPHFMLKEIHEQPATVQNAMRGRLVRDEGYAHLGGLNMTEDELRNIRRIVLIACGTSWHAALIGEYMIEERARLPVEVEYASEFRYRNPIIEPGTLVLAISQSGETVDTLEAMREAQRRGCRALGICNVVGSTIARESDGGVYIHAGPEIGVASTKAFTSQVTVLSILALLLGRMRYISREEGRAMVEALNNLSSQIQTILDRGDHVRRIAEEYAQHNNFLYLGRGPNFPVALEGALKLKEIAYVHAEGYPAAEMKHGPIALIDENMPVVVIATRDGAYSKILSNMEEVKARKGRIISIACEGDRDVERVSDHVITIPNSLDILYPILAVIPLQLLAYHMAVLRGCDVDQPRNLAKSVTVE